MRHGVAAGAFSNVACLSLAGAQAWTDRMASDIGGGARPGAPDLPLHGRARRAVPGAARLLNAALDKLLAAIGGWGPVGTRLRRPYRWIDEAEAERLRPVARSMMPELFAA